MSFIYPIRTSCSTNVSVQVDKKEEQEEGREEQVEGKEREMEEQEEGQEQE